MMKKIGLVATLGVATLAVAATGTGLAFASDPAVSHTLKLTSVQTSQKMFGTHFADADKDVVKGKVIGYDVVNGVYHATSKTITVSFAASLQGGIIYGQGTGSVVTGKLKGTITGGTGSYHGITGTVTGQATGKHGDNEVLVLTYH